jgi:hypothetical protein
MITGCTVVPAAGRWLHQAELAVDETKIGCTRERCRSRTAPRRAAHCDVTRSPCSPYAVGIAQVVLEALSPAERLAFVLHDMFTVPFDEIASRALTCA